MRISPFSTALATIPLIVAVFSGCFAKHDNPQLYTFPSRTLTYQSALLHAIDLNGRSPLGQLQSGLYHVLDTKSMEPVLQGGDYIVVDTRFPYDKLTKGVLVTYQARWAPAPQPPVTHRLQVRMPEGWVAEGDQNGINGANPKSGLESARITPAEYIGKVVGIYRTRL